MQLSGLFTGEQHELLPAEDFAMDTDLSTVRGLDEVEEDAELLSYETPQMAAELVVVNAGYPEEQAWAAMAVAMARLCHILGGKREQYQHNEYTSGGSTLAAIRYTFRYEAADDGSWTGERF
jgi:hypothetical protein